MSYDITIGSSTLQLYGVINNIFDKTPPITPSYGALGSSAIQVNSSLYDVLGRRYTLGFRLQM